ncbi:MAG: hypothetical protein ACR2JR_07870 [Rubrobacteraceae bacterium]
MDATVTDVTDPARTWKELQARLADSFTARTSGLLAPEISLSGSEGEFARMRLRGLAGADVVAGPPNSTIERIGDARYRMLTGGMTTLVAKPAGSSADSLEIKAGERAYETRASFLRNTAEARSHRGEEIVRLEGNLTGRSYKVVFDPETDDALAVAVFLLYHTAAHRNRAFRVG